MIKLDILAFGAHPDDVELGAAGTLIAHINRGYKCGIIDLTRGELGTRGNADTRMSESEKASRIIGIHVRENLGMEDGFFQNDKKNQLAIVSVIRKYRPEIILSNAISDRHPDHPKGAGLVSVSAFLAGLSKVETLDEGEIQEPWRTRVHYHYIQDRYLKPDLSFDITDVWEQKLDAVKSFKTQFYDPTSTERETPISTSDFLEFLEGRAMDFGRSIGVRYAEGYTCERTPGVNNFFELL